MSAADSGLVNTGALTAALQNISDADEMLGRLEAVLHIKLRVETMDNIASC